MPLGFTLIELLVVLVIISVMVGFVGPRLAGSISNTSLKTASKRIAASLRYARSQAISESRSYEAVFDLEKNQMIVRSGQTARKDEAGEEDDAIKKGVFKPYLLPDDVRFEKAIWRDEEGDSGLFRILFVPNGGSSGGELLLRNKRGHRYRITVDVITGTAKVRSDETGS
ncbi:MAG: GspH/FimT family pseudopilin [Deltaproteobacteria bacterium]|nr:GspH/FimT family pseudopilin [Deltaproteobacteria bacterium]